MDNHNVRPEHQLTYLWVTVFGPTGTNGLVGNVKNLAESVKRHDALEAQILFILRLLQWIGVIVGTTVGLLASGPLADLLRTILGAGK